MTLQQLRYVTAIAETGTYELIEDVALLRSEVGILYLNKDNETVLRKVIREHDLQFTPLFTARPHVFVSAASPQCGFASCEIGNKLTDLEQWNKLKLVKEIAEEVWGK